MQLLHKDNFSLKRHTEPSFILSLPALLFLLVVASAETMLYVHKTNLEKSDQIDTLAFATDLQVRAELELGAVLHLTSGLDSYLSVRHVSLEKSEIESILQLAYNTSQNVRNFGVAVGYNLTFVYPVSGNEAAIGLDYRNLPTQWPAVEQAVVEKRAVLAENVELLQGGKAFIYRNPIFIDNQYWGLLSTVIDSEAFLTHTFSAITTNNFQFAVRGASGTLLWGDANLFADPAALIVASERDWQFAVKSQQGNRHVLLTVLRVLGWCLALALSLGLYSLLSHRRTLAHMILHDVVTGLPNQRLLNNRLEYALESAKKHKHKSLRVVFIGINDFKKINDTYGHDAGDFVLKTTAQRLAFCVYVGDTVARWVGDEFVLLTENISPVEFPEFLQRLVKAIGEPLYFQGHALRISVALGQATAFEDADTIEGLIAQAEQRMGFARSQGKALTD
jgi:diguanylate cyclase (GGDEF)-like protein